MNETLATVEVRVDPGQVPTDRENVSLRGVNVDQVVV